MTRRLPLFPLSTVLFPEGPLALRIFEPRYVDMVSRCMRDGSGFAVVLLLEGSEAGQPSVSTAMVGTEARIVDFDRLEDGLLGLTCVGQERVRIISAWREADGLNMAEVALAVEHLYPTLPSIYPQWAPARYKDARWVGNRLAELAPFDANVRQELLEMSDPLARLRTLSPLVQLRDSDESH
jgi:Lon protease-like protein